MSSEDADKVTGSRRCDKRLRRATHACARCRVRKVRCDVAVRGKQCTNCLLDGQECRIECSERAKRRRRRAQGLAGCGWPNEDPSVSLLGHGHRERHAHLDSDSIRHSEPQTEPRGQDGNARLASSKSTSNASFIDANQVYDIGPDGSRSPVGPTPAIEGSCDQGTREKVVVSLQAEGCANGPTKAGEDAFPSLIDDAVSSSHYIGYSYYQFLAVDNIPHIPAREYQFLEHQGCLHVPVRPILDVFVRQYFLHMHPMLPIHDEGVFWDIYDQQTSNAETCRTISLLVFQAMLFSCCNVSLVMWHRLEEYAYSYRSALYIQFVPETTLNQIGFNTTRTARATFYRRAKLLFDLETDSSFISMSQAALLLASWSFSSYDFPRKPNIPWLSIAIQHARDADAHNYKSFCQGSEKYEVRKRLWWCCIIRDRLFALGMRRPLKIPAAQFDVVQNSGLGYYELVGELHRSKVHDLAVKVQLANVLELLVELCIMLTDILELAFPMEASLTHCSDGRDTQRRVHNSRVALRKWHSEATLRLADPAASSEEANQDDSVILYSNLVYMYYHSTKATLGHYEILQLTTAAVPSSTASANIFALEHNHFELQNAALEITCCLQKLAYRRLIKWLPVTAVSCTALPLLLHILGREVSSSLFVESPSQSNLITQRLQVLRMAMETYQLQYEGVSWISETINRVVTMARAGSTSIARALITPSNPQHSKDREGCVTMLTFRPAWYLIMAFSIDVALSKGRLPKDQNSFRSFHELILAEMPQSKDGPNRLLGEDYIPRNNPQKKGKQPDALPLSIYAPAPSQRMESVAKASYTITDITDSWEILFANKLETERPENSTVSGFEFSANTASAEDTLQVGDEGSGMTYPAVSPLLGREGFDVNCEFPLDITPI
ncbi:hypothetical protein BJY01DRAFT_244862 [Aspergillus pseudoustus]|uniref:Zn(2)-C6 fungal-type domain-containing protein n=1 Tax=Aspergillus pseudoustus TaxID=1810923 RepID=A0ABR4KI12_9EURO